MQLYSSIYQFVHYIVYCRLFVYYCVVLFGLMATRLNKHYCYYYMLHMGFRLLFLSATALMQFLLPVAMLPIWNRFLTCTMLN